MRWHHVSTPGGAEGYVPAQYTVDMPPATPTVVATLIPTASNTPVPAVATARPTQAPVVPGPISPRACCRLCTTGQACGNACISRSFTCHVGVGCACNGGVLDHFAAYSPEDQAYVLALLRVPEAIVQAYVFGILKPTALQAQTSCPTDTPDLLAGRDFAALL
jgi:hypothetical protein